jgi:L-ascorbate metabolism protein UlaG (beta-lactamase superfamily)
VKLLQPKYVIPVHYNTWDLLAQDVQAWAKRVSAETSTQVHISKPGESFTL